MAIAVISIYLVALVATLIWATISSGADAVKCPAGSKPAGNGCIDVKPVFIERCPSAHKAVKFYAGRIAMWRDKMGQRLARDAGSTRSSTGRCPRYLAHVLQRKAYGLRKEYRRWRKAWEHDYAWWLWLPEKFQRVAACETGHQGGTGPGGSRWDWDSGTYVTAWGIIRPAYEAYHHWTGHNTPREQYEVAASIQARYGWGAWGCGGA